MKLRTSSSDMTILKKDITRFAPAWVLYIVASLLTLLLIVQFDTGYYLAEIVATSAIPMAFCAFCYAFLVAELLFGDLFNARLCNALHAMPMRRERWFGTHVTAGILFGFVPHLIFAVLSGLMMGELWKTALLWMLAVDLQYLFFFSLAVFSMLCVGNRFAAAMVYGLLNFLSLIAAWFIDTLYLPMLYGLELDISLFELLCPLSQMLDSYQLIDVSRTRANEAAPWIYKVSCGEGWLYLAVCAVIGVLLLLAALAFYRRRKLESAGDFIAVQALEPIFLVLYTLTVGAMLHILSNIFADEVSYIFLTAGIAIGFFTGQMFIKRTIRVFSKKTFLGFAVFALVLWGSLGLTKLDPLGITRWIPQTDEVESVTLQFRSSYYGTITLDEAEEIEDMRYVHAKALENRIHLDYDYSSYYRAEDGTRHPVAQIVLSYKLKNGATAQRHYPIAVDTVAGERLRRYFSSREFVLGLDLETAEEYVNKFYFMEVDSHQVLDDAQKIGLMEAILADCDAGNMVQVGEFHDDETTSFYTWFQYDEHVKLPSIEYRYRDLRIYDCCENVKKWVSENIDPDWMEDDFDKTGATIPAQSGS